MKHTAETETTGLDAVRNRSAMHLAIGCCAMVPLSVLAAWLAGNSLIVAGGSASLFAILCVVGAKLRSLQGRVLVALGLVGQAICITAALSGHAWQLDSHMLFFAILAACMVLSEPVVIISAAAMIAVHHLSLSIAMPALVYPSSSLFDNLQRTAIHGVIVVVEAAILWSAIRNRNIAHEKSVADTLKISAAAQEAKLAVERIEAEQSKTETALLAAKEAQQQALEATRSAEAETEKAIEADKKARELEEQERRNRSATEAEQNKVVSALREALAKLSQGDLSEKIDDPFPQNYEELRSAFNTAVSELQDAMSLVGDNADTIGMDVSSIEQAADNLAKRTEAQAATVEETSAAISQIAGNSKSAAESAREATQAVDAAQAKTNESETIVTKAVSAMSEIENSSGQIAKIVQLIEDIAFQTNLLALNAGVEAARAGDAGRGFSVVASEVRELARRSSEAAKEIGELIDASGKQVSCGVGLVRETGAALQSISVAVEDISTHVSVIASSAEEQSVSISETNDAIRQLDTVTQQNAAMFEETNAVTQSLAQQAKQLKSAIARFKMNARSADTPIAFENRKPAPHSPSRNLSDRPSAYSVDGNAALDISTDAPADPAEGWEEF
ncbi:methyl-accepting chemotaxis protein [Roseobacter sp. YSTF-M11]|uniref:Methyl-accepting chemotaxis protein n=1 Tax=Roseobacter insulae TaxID=2859783 RepID=A0A9X1FZ87_9RHOB|nr:methyl-accepting chemotaxis protein [Roseobacter insulae]MBW4710328.1 methyl-accepting chemotaxis protein [Roseobacter insulae]